jgi:hypothetical protein
VVVIGVPGPPWRAGARSLKSGAGNRESSIF